jgi:imidazoleglycerol phosphate synthase glutamine amidotransferase subunit HisH
MLKKHLTVSNGIEEALEDALIARNRLIHRVLIDNIEQIPQATTRTSLVKEIRTLRSKVQKADKMLRPFATAFNKALDEVDQQKLEQEFRQLLS